MSRVAPQLGADRQLRDKTVPPHTTLEQLFCSTFFLSVTPSGAWLASSHCCAAPLFDTTDRRVHATDFSHQRLVQPRSHARRRQHAMSSPMDTTPTRPQADMCVVCQEVRPRDSDRAHPPFLTPPQRLAANDGKFAAPCGHVFHVACAERCYVVGGATRCPTCRAEWAHAPGAYRQALPSNAAAAPALRWLAAVRGSVFSPVPLAVPPSSCNRLRGNGCG